MCLQAQHQIRGTKVGHPRAGTFDGGDLPRGQRPKQSRESSPRGGVTGTPHGSRLLGGRLIAGGDGGIGGFKSEGRTFDERENRELWS